MSKLISPILFCFFSIVYLIGCTGNTVNNPGKEEPVSPLFTLLPPDSTNITFHNTLAETLNTNVLIYEYFYNGGGVAIADLNNDGLEDIYFTGNMSDSKLYLNKGNLTFEDITALAGAETRKIPWRTGVTIADVNGDGKRDIFVSYSGKVRGENRLSQLFINTGNDNNGIPHFNEQAEQFGLADSSYNTQSYFFDFDRDGDLDMFALNHNPDNLPVLDEASTMDLLKKSDKNIGVRLYINNNNHFEDVTVKAGLSSTVLTYGLGAGISDINSDGWPDIYIANDYNVPDYLYINNKNGTFTDRLQSSLGHTSRSSMGNNVADINNDGLPDIYVLDMLPEDNKRQKLLLAPDNYEKFDVTVRSGFYYQYMRNMLQLNNGDGTFSEIGQLAGISNTDWSWAPLFADYDNDGWKDLYVTNGYTRDFTNMDFLKYMNDYVQSKGRLSREEVMQILQKMPASNVINYVFKNNGNLTFSDVSKQWGIITPSNSNGAAYADLDNDGDLDLVVNNVNEPAFIYRNNTNRLTHHHYLNIQLHGAEKNTDGIGAKIFLYVNGKSDSYGMQFLEQMPARGYESTVSPVLHFGMGKNSMADSLKVIWPNDKEQVILNVKADQLITLKQKDANRKYQIQIPAKSIYEEINPPLNYKYAKAIINDFKRQPLLINPLSYSGPCMIKGDVNGDKLEDIFIGGEYGKAGTLYIQQQDRSFRQKPQPAFEKDKLSEDADAVFADFNNDGFPDLYIASGGYNNFTPNDVLLQDRLYINDGRANFSKATKALPEMYSGKGCVSAADINGDGFIDLFVGGRVIPGQYPETPESFLLINDGRGNFADKISSIAPELQKIGMVTDAKWIDLNNDKKPDLIVAGEWMPVSVFINSDNKLENKTKHFFNKEYGGWWNKMLVADLNNDGKEDLVIGNTGLNTQCKASDEEPAGMYYKDFDNNGSVDPIFCFYIQHKTYPYLTRDELLEQMTGMRTKFTDYKTYADAGIKEIFSEEEMKDAKYLQANELKTSYFERSADGKFIEKPLPVQAQFSPVFTITDLDYNKDGNPDLLLCGNINRARLRFGKSDANYGILLKGDGKGNFTYIDQQQSGFHLWGDVRSVININDQLLFGINENNIKAYKLR